MLLDSGKIKTRIITSLCVFVFSLRAPQFLILRVCSLLIFPLALEDGTALVGMVI
jgi:hypothetical protein